MGRQRQRAEKLLAAQRERIEQVEEQISAELDRLISASGVAPLSPTAKSGSDHRQRAEAISRETENLEKSRRELADAKRQIDDAQRHFAEEQQQATERLREKQVDLDGHRADSEAAAARARQAEHELQLAQARHETAAQRLADRDAQCADWERRLATEREQIELAREQTKIQRRRIADELRAKRSSQQRELNKQQHDLEREQQDIDRRKADLESQATAVAAQKRGVQQDRESSATDTSTQVNLLQRQLDQARAELEKAEHWALESDAQAGEFRRNHERLESEHQSLARQYSGLERQYDEVERQHSDLERQRADVDRQQAELTRRLDDSQVERQSLTERLAAAETSETSSAAAGQQRGDEMQRRFEMAVDDARNLKRRNSELEEQVLSLKANAAYDSPRGGGSGESMDWEATKKRLLASLDAETDDDPQRTDERVTIESTIAITDDIVSQKDQEIAELHLLLAQQSSSIGSVAVGASAVDAALQQDELIRQEREKLAALQVELHEKLREAEIDISVERARIARERAEIVGKQQTFDAARDKQTGEAGDVEPGASKTSRGRWLSRLGLKE